MKPSSKSETFAECCKISDLATLAWYSGLDYIGSKESLCMGDKRLKFKSGKQKEFLEKCIEELGSQSKLAGFLGVGKSTLRGWLKEVCNIPKSKFYFLLENFPKYKNYQKVIEEELDWNWGWIKGGQNCLAKKENLKDYLKYVRSFIKNKERTKKNSAIKIENDLLEKLKSENVDLISILAVCTLTDGYLEKRGISFSVCFSSSDQILINFIQALFFELSDYLPSTYGPSKGAYNTYVSDAKLGKKLLQLSPEFKTYASDSSKQPTINFLNNQNFQTKIWATRFAFTADGCVFLPKNVKTSKPGLIFSCCNKAVCYEWLDFLKQFGIYGRVINSKRYKERVAGIRVYCREGISNFQKLGGFVDGVKISRKSKYHCGLTKNEVLQRVINTFE